MNERNKQKGKIDLRGLAQELESGVIPMLPESILKPAVLMRQNEIEEEIFFLQSLKSENSELLRSSINAEAKSKIRLENSKIRQRLTELNKHTPNNAFFGVGQRSPPKFFNRSR